MTASKKLSFILILILSLALITFTSGCFGSNADSDGVPSYVDDGDDGDDGDEGDDGEAGASGISCWDLNEDGIRDIVTEDLNGDLTVNALDCSALCWDENNNGVKDTAEDKNADGVVDAKDCTPEGTYCLDEDENGYCDTIGGGTPQCEPDDPTCIDPCADVEGVDTVAECISSCIESLVEIDPTATATTEICYNQIDDDGDELIDCADEDCASNMLCDGCQYFDLATGEIIEGNEACIAICTDTCESFGASDDECPPAYIIPDYYKSKEIEVKQCSVYWDVLTITGRYMQFESYHPSTMNTWNISVNNDTIAGFNDNTAVGKSLFCDRVSDKYKSMAAVEIDAEEFTWVNPAVDYFEFTDIEIDYSEPIFVVFGDVLGKNFYKIKRIADNHHRDGQLTFMVEFLSSMYFSDEYYLSLYYGQQPMTTNFTFYYKPLVSDFETVEEF